MSFIVQIWESPPESAKPTTRAEAEALQEGLRGGPASADDRWTAFAEARKGFDPDGRLLNDYFRGLLA